MVTRDDDEKLRVCLKSGCLNEKLKESVVQVGGEEAAGVRVGWPGKKPPDEMSLF